MSNIQKQQLNGRIQESRGLYEKQRPFTTATHSLPTPAQPGQGSRHQ
ncbi:MAG: hypothetical protein H6656_21335 [Ardenticatenaceae bacterium]|nr:hypothetical protein [Ardenticatenaceae bacterium]